MNIIIINGPNLNLLGKRQPEIYGNISFEEYFNTLQQKFPQHTLQYFQSNVEGDLINKLQETGFNFDGIILNAGGYTHTSVAIADVVEVHISNIFAREEYRHVSLISKHAKGVISGLGLKGYNLAIEGFE
jgi:3-dehydroquinate dehydratase-2